MPVQTKVTTINVATSNISTTYTFTGLYKNLILSCTKDCYIIINTATAADTTSFFMQVGIQYTIPVQNPATISYIRSAADGRLTIMALS